jgi:hypothetical protein
MTTTLSQKLQIKPPRSLLVLNPPPGMLERLARELPGIPVVTMPSAGSDAVLVFVNNAAEVRAHLPEAARLVLAGALWVSYPKMSSGVSTDINRDSLWKMIEPFGWRPVRQVALDETWSALRFKPS